MPNLKPYVLLITWAALILVLPSLGAWLGGHPLAEFLRFPLVTRDWDPLPYSPGAYWSSLASVGLVALLALWLGIGRHTPAVHMTPASGSLPAWTWGAAPLLLGAPYLAAAGMPLVGGVLFTGGLLAALNGDLVRRTGHCPVLERPGWFLSLLPAGLLLGMAVEYLNLFLHSWHHPGLADLGSGPAALLLGLEHALLLPLMLSLRQWLASHQALLRPLAHGRPLPVKGDQQAGWLLVGIAAMGLAGAGIWPERIYPLAWMAPLLLALGLPLIAGKPTLLAGIQHGDWSRIVLTAAAALLLGVLELAWNGAFGPTWRTSLPLLQGPALLGLPLPAYGQFVVLGLTGLWLADQLIAPWHKRPKGRFPRFPIKVVIK